MFFRDCGEMSISASSTLKRGNPCRAASNVSEYICKLKL